VALGREIISFVKNGEWQMDWVVVTEIITAGSTTIAVSSQKGAHCTLEAKGELPQIDLANASIGLKMISAQAIGYQVIAERGLCPLLGLSKAHKPFFQDEAVFRPVEKGLIESSDDSDHYEFRDVI
jgi:hypothetical protein